MTTVAKISAAAQVILIIQRLNGYSSRLFACCVYFVAAPVRTPGCQAGVPSSQRLSVSGR